MEGINRTDQYLNYYSILRKTVKWMKKILLFLVTCALLNAFFVYKIRNKNQDTKYTKFLRGSLRSWVSETKNLISPTTIPRRSKQHPENRYCGNVSKYNLEKSAGAWKRKKHLGR
jgi:hypothetical protein